MQSEPSSGGSPITKYKVSISSENGANPYTDVILDNITFVENGPWEYIWTGLPSATTRVFKLSSYNLYGWSTPSVASDKQTTADAAPNVVADLSAPTISVTSRNCLLTWTNPRSNGQAIERFIIQRACMGTSSPDSAVHCPASAYGNFSYFPEQVFYMPIGIAPAPTQTFTVTGLVFSTTYIFRIIAVNILGHSDPRWVIWYNSHFMLK